MDTWEIEASSGTYLWQAETARKALFAFETASPDDFVHSVKKVVYTDDGEWVHARR